MDVIAWLLDQEAHATLHKDCEDAQLRADAGIERFPLAAALEGLGSAIVALDDGSDVVALLSTGVLLSVCIPRPAATKSPTPLVAPELDIEGFRRLAFWSVLVELDACLSTLAVTLPLYNKYESY